MGGASKDEKKIVGVGPSLWGRHHHLLTSLPAYPGEVACEVLI